MLLLTPQNIHLRASARNKEEAIREAGRVLVECGCIDPGYVESMLGREKQANTFLGNGIAIPHGMLKDRELISNTGVSVVQFPDGVEWNPGQKVFLVVGIAARSDEHLEILSALTDVLDDEATAQRLANTESAQEIISRLGGKAQTPKSTILEDISGAKSVEAVVKGEAGLHARPATHFAEISAKFASEIRVSFSNKTANGKVMASLLKLGAAKGSVLEILASGPDSEEALVALKTAVDAGLGEEEQETAKDAFTEAVIWKPTSRGHAIAGVPASPGVAIGPVYQFKAAHIIVKDTPPGKDAELHLKQAIAEANTQINAIHDSVQERAGKAEAAIFRAHLALLNDTELLAEVCLQIDMGHGAAWSWQHAIEGRVAEMRQLENERLAERATDLHDVGQRVLKLLAGSEETETQFPDHPVILLADDLTPSDTAKLDPKRILGLCTAAGGPTAHTAIIARSLDIPAVVAAGGSILAMQNGTIVILDGAAGTLYIEPSPEDLESAKHFQQDQHGRRNEEFELRYDPAMLTDGHRVEIVANIGKASEAAAAVEAGAEGVGLMRTEFLFLDRQSPPTEDEQFEAYSEMTRALNGLPIIIRTLDIGGDKIASYVSMPKEENPFLGVRGIRLCLRQPEIFLPQLRAIFRASATGPVRIMFPMISTLEEFQTAKQLAEQVRLEVGVPPVEYGIMVEVPSTVLMAPEFAKEVDFFSIGTNDLTQYTMAMDRLHASLAKNVDGLHPAVLRLIQMTVKAAKSEGKWVGVCGGVAGDPAGAAILTGLGVAELSMSLPSIAAVKACLRKLSLSQAEKLANQALACGSATEVRQLGLR